MPVGDWFVLKNVLRVGVVLDEKGMVTVKGTVTADELLALSEAVITIGKFCRGCANKFAVMEKESGLVGVKKPCGVPIMI